MLFVNKKKHAERMQILYERHRVQLLKGIVCEVRDRSAAEDICQDAFMLLDKNLHKVPDHKAAAWLFSVSSRMIRDYLGEEQMIAIDVAEQQGMFLRDEETEPEWILECREQREACRRALDCLRRERPHWFRVLNMRYIEEKSNEEIAKELGISANLVSQWKRRATGWLRRLRQEEE